MCERLGECVRVRVDVRVIMGRGARGVITCGASWRQSVVVGASRS